MQRCEEEEDFQVNGGKKVGKRCRMIANNVIDMLEFEEDTRENYEDSKLPILDLKHG